MPLFRSVKLKGNGVSAVIRNTKTLETLIQKSETLRTINILQQNPDELLEQYFKEQSIAFGS